MMVTETPGLQVAELMANRAVDVPDSAAAQHFAAVPASPTEISSYSISAVQHCASGYKHCARSNRSVA